jgi:hypothetical protein
MGQQENQLHQSPLADGIGLGVVHDHPCWRECVQSTIREARLKPEYAALYPGVEPGVWLPATVVGQQLLLWHLTAAATPQGDRLMSDEHFDFRGGQKRVGSWINMRTRLVDE